MNKTVRSYCYYYFSLDGHSQQTKCEEKRCCCDREEMKNMSVHTTKIIFMLLLTH